MCYIYIYITSQAHIKHSSKSHMLQEGNISPKETNLDPLGKLRYYMICKPQGPLPPEFEHNTFLLPTLSKQSNLYERT